MSCRAAPRRRKQERKAVEESSDRSSCVWMSLFCFGSRLYLHRPAHLQCGVNNYINRQKYIKVLLFCTCIDRPIFDICIKNSDTSMHTNVDSLVHITSASATYEQGTASRLRDIPAVPSRSSSPITSPGPSRANSTGACEEGGRRKEGGRGIKLY